MNRTSRSLSFRTLTRARLTRRPLRPTRLALLTLEERTLPTSIFAVGTDAGSSAQVKVFDAQTQALKFTLTPYLPAFHGGVRVAVADVTGDGQADVVTAQGTGGNNTVRVYNGATGKALSGGLGSFAAFTKAQADGVWVAAGDVTGDGKADLILSADGPSAAKVKVINGANGALVRNVDVSKLGLAGGVRVAAGDLNADGKADVIAAGGPGGAARVAAFDGGNGKPLYDFFPFEPGYTGGVTIAAGDVTGDGHSDLIAGRTGGGWAKVFSGKDTASTWNLNAFPGSTAGVRVGAADADGDGRLDVVAADGVGGGRVRIYAADRGGQLADLAPLGTAYKGGLFVAGDPQPAGGGVTLLTDKPDVYLVSVEDTTEGKTAYLTFGRTGDTKEDLTASVSVTGGTAGGGDYTAAFYVYFGVGESKTYAETNYVAATADTDPEGPETVTFAIDSDPDFPYDVGSPSSGVVTIFDDDAPASAAPLATSGSIFDRCDDALGNSPGSPDRVADLPNTNDPEPIQTPLPAYLPDEVTGWLSAAILASGEGDGIPMFSTCPPFAGLIVSAAWGFGYDAFGLGVDLSELPSLEDADNVTLLWRCDSPQYFDESGSTYSARHGATETLSHNPTSKEFSLTDSTGQQFVFHDFDTSHPVAARGRLKTQKDSNGNAVLSATYNGSGQLTNVARARTTGSTTSTVGTAYTYLTSGTNSGKVSTITLTEQVGGGSAVTVRTASLAYHDGTGSGGIAGNLKEVAIKDTASPTPNTLQTSYLRYYTSDNSTGYSGGLKYAVTGAAYDRLKAWANANSTTVDAATDAQVAPFADVFLEYGVGRRVSRADVQGAGCSACSGGLGSYTYAYATSAFADGYNSWRTKRAETRPDGSEKVVYYNFALEPVLAVHKEGGSEWLTAYRYDASGRLVTVAAPSSVSGYDESKADLLNNQSGNYQHLRDSQGLIGTLSYFTSTTATATTAGGVSGYLHQTALQRGETGTSVLQGTNQYFQKTANGITVNPVATATVYRNGDGTGGQTTSYAWTWQTGTVMPASLTVTYPTVTTGQNGSGSATSEVVFFDSYGRPQWTKDAGGFLTYVARDDATNAVVTVIADVDHTKTSTFANLPSGWTTPTGGGLHLTVTSEVDDLGRATKTTDANGNVTYVVYRDDLDEVRVYAGWDATNLVPTGPTQVYREDGARKYTETLTMSATPAVTSGKPTGTEAISGIQSLSRQVVNDAGQPVAVDIYHDLTGVTYSQSSVTLGSAGTNYNRTEQAFDKLGLPNRTLSPTGTIYRQVNDGQGRPVSSWVGTDDTPTTGF